METLKIKSMKCPLILYTKSNLASFLFRLYIYMESVPQSVLQTLCSESGNVINEKKFL